MAIQKDTQFTGTVDHLIFYNWLGIYCIRMLPKTIRQTDATKRAAGTFGLVSSRSKIIRDSLKAFIAAPRDKRMQVGLKRALSKTLQYIETPPLVPAEIPLMGFRFNETLPLEELLRIPIQVARQPNDKIRIDIPAINPSDSITTLVATTSVRLKLMTLCFSFVNDQSFIGRPEIINIRLTDEVRPETVVELEAPRIGACITVVLATLCFWNKDTQINPYGVKPLEIVAVFEQPE